MRGIKSTGLLVRIVSILLGFGGATLGYPTAARATVAGSAATGGLQLSLSSYLVAQGSGLFSAGVERIGGSSGSVSVQYSTLNGSALAGTDYSAASGVLQWADGDSSPKVLSIPISTAALFSGTKTFSLVLSNPSGGSSLGNPAGASVIIEGGASSTASSLQLSLSNYVVAQGSGLFSASVERTGDSSGSISVQYSTADGTALAGADYSAADGLLQWAAGDSSPKVFNIPVSTAVPFSGTKSFSVVLSNPAGEVGIGTPGTAPVTIMGAAPTGAVAMTPAGIMSYLGGLTQGSSHRVLSGQHASFWNTPLTSAAAAMDVVTPLAAETGQNPAILGLVLNYATDSYAITPDVTQSLANQWWAQGGLVLVSLYDNDPTFSYNSSGAPIHQSIPSSAFHQLTVQGSDAYVQWHSQLDTYAAALHSLTDSGNTVLFRPFIELNGDWNWYGAENPADFIAVWQDMYQYLMITKGLKNVLWIYNVNSGVGQYMDYYPGANYVDIVGMDIYDYGQNIVADVNTGGMYPSLVATGKPLIVPEIGLAPPPGPSDDTQDNVAIIDDIRSSLPNVVGFVVFNGSWAVCNQNNAFALMNDPWIVNLGGLSSGH